jgi:hypothetical protein
MIHAGRRGTVTRRTRSIPGILAALSATQTQWNHSRQTETTNHTGLFRLFLG